MVAEISPASIMIIERCPVTNANPPMTVKQIAPAMSQRRNKAMTMAPSRQCDSAHEETPDHPPRAPFFFIKLKNVTTENKPPLHLPPLAAGEINPNKPMTPHPTNKKGGWIPIQKKRKTQKKPQPPPP